MSAWQNCLLTFINKPNLWIRVKYIKEGIEKEKVIGLGNYLQAF